MLGLVCLRRPGCGGQVRGWLVTQTMLSALIDSIRNFGVVHAEAGVLHEKQARLFDEMIANLQKEAAQSQQVS